MEGSPNHNKEILQHPVNNAIDPLVKVFYNFMSQVLCSIQLYDAILFGNLVEVNRCLEGGAFVNPVLGQAWVTPLHLAVACGHISITRLLLERGADVRRRDKEGREAVHIAAALGNLELLKLLIHYSCDVNSEVAPVTSAWNLDLLNEAYPNHHLAMEKIPKMAKLDTPLSLARNANNKEECVIILIEHGAKIDFDKTTRCYDESSRNAVLARYVIDMLDGRFDKKPSKPPVVKRHGEEFRLTTTCLHEATDKKDLLLIDFLIDFDPCQITKEIDSLNPLHRTVNNELLKPLEKLLANAKISQILDAQDKDMCTPLYLAVQQGWLSGVKVLLKAGANVTLHSNKRQTVLHLAAELSQPEILDELLKTSGSREIIDTHNHSQETPLWLAVRAGQLRNVTRLLSEGAGSNLTMTGGRTLLHLAAEKGHSEILEKLIQACMLRYCHGSDTYGLTALHVAAYHGSESCVDTLIKNRFDVYKKTEVYHDSESTPLHLATMRGHINVVKRIVRHKEDTINIKDAKGNTPLLIAAKSANEECLRFMLLNGADIGATVRDELGIEMTALEYIVNNIHNAEDFLTETLDQCIIEETDPDNSSKAVISVKYDLFKPSSYGNQLKVLESFLNCENEDVEENLLLHPVVETCLYVKWRRFMTFFFAMIALYMTHTLSLTIMVMYLYTTESQTSFANHFVFICRCTLSGSLLLVILLELLLASRMQRYHFKDLESWVRWTMILLSLLVLVGDHPAEWLIDVSAVAVLLSWLELLFQISRWHSFPGLYVLMFFTVAKNVMKVMATFFFVILGYVFAFMIYFQAKGPFRDWPTSFYKVMVMMNELDYESVFEDFRKEDVLVGRGIFLSFMVLVAIVLMNLLVGLAVDDIQNLKKKGKAKCLAKQIGFLCMLELFVYNINHSTSYPKILVKLFGPWKIEDNKLIIVPENSQSCINTRLKASLIKHFMKRKRLSKEASKGEDRIQAGNEE